MKWEELINQASLADARLLIFSIYYFVAKPQKNKYLDGLKWRDLVMGR